MTPPEPAPTTCLLLQRRSRSTSTVTSTTGHSHTSNPANFFAIALLLSAVWKGLPRGKVDSHSRTHSASRPLPSVPLCLDTLTIGVGYIIRECKVSCSFSCQCCPPTSGGPMPV